MDKVQAQRRVSPVLIPIAWRDPKHTLGVYGEDYREHFGIWEQILGGPVWNLTHLPTGRCLGHFYTKEMAKVCADRLLVQMPNAPWTKSIEEWTRDIGERAKLIVQEVYEEEESEDA